MTRNWFAQTAVDGAITRITEPRVHPTFRANIWHVAGRDADLLVDTGMGLSPLLPELRTSGKPLIAVATHIHVDHVGGLHQFARRFGPALSADGFATMDERLTYADMFRELDDPVAHSPMPGWSVADYRIAPAPLTRSLREGDAIDLGDRVFRVIELPGHSPDSIGMLDEHEGILFSGDAIYDDDLLDDLPDSDRTAYRATMQRLSDLPVRIAHGGHGPSFDQVRLREIAYAYLNATHAA